MKYLYLLLGLSLLAPTLCVTWFRKDLASKALKIGCFGGVAGLLAEFFYFKDYWRPPSLFGVATVSAEDFIFGFTITALSVVVYPFVTRRVFRGGQYPNRLRLYGIYFAVGVACMLFFNVFLQINSIVVSSAVFVVSAASIVTLRRDLLRQAVYSAGVLLLIGIYIILFDWLAPHYWDTYWLLAGTSLDVRFFGDVPFTEMLWYVTWVAFASISYPFVSGATLERRQ